ncbi:sensor histidine kinase [Terricaulis sp.]|uniref:sensor histidine kinase n=1 Tax=Terricaulis sp. TaxID=2768686 RepID=UPI002AC69B05|nr:PAS-domain containing protein [Terricaulis sp.]MDZ4691898.1 PAS-domain containing protein [Terricaulis sp.]
MDGGFASLLVAGGSASIAVAALLWALRVTDGARGSVETWKKRARDLEDKIAWADAIFGAHPGIVLIWEDTLTNPGEGDWGKPRIYGSPLALASLLRFSDAAVAAEPPVRILQGLSVFDATDATGALTRLAPAITRLRRDGAAFSIKISTPDGVYVEVDGRTAGARAVAWILDASVRGVEEGAAGGRIGSSGHEVIARDPAAFLEMWNGAPFMAWRVNGALKLEWANPDYLAALEAKTLDQALARNLQLDQGAVDLARKAIELGEAVEETRSAVVGGQLRTLRLRMSPVAGGAAGIAIDVTESEAARELLSKQQRAHDETLNHLAEGIAVFDQGKRITFYNRAFEAMWGLDPAFLADRPVHAAWLDHLKEKRKLPAHANYAEWRARELALYQEHDNLPEDLWVLPDARMLRVARQPHPNGGMLMIFSDITNEVSLKSQYDALVQTQKAALDKLHEAIVVFGLDGRLKLSNAAFAAMWKVEPDALENEAPFDRVVELCQHLFHDRAEWARVRGRITDPSPEARTEYRGEMRRSDESVLKFLTRPLPDGATLVAFQDITADRRVEEALRERAEAFEQADQLKGQFVENVSYQLRNPLQAIYGNAELLQAKVFGPLNDRQVEQVGSIIEASSNLSKLIDNILDVAMVEAGNVVLDLAPVDIYATITESVQMAASKARDTEVPIRVKCDAKIGEINADPKRLTQVIVNLLSNALRHTERGDTITVSAERMDGVLRLTVQDTGKGMAFDAQARAFDSFQSGDRRGAGLGLALVRSFVEMHGGWVALQSEPGRGVTVTCHLPATTPIAGPPPSPPSREAA